MHDSPFGVLKLPLTNDLIVLGHVEVSEKSNEIPAAQTLIESMVLPGRVFTLDTLHCPPKNSGACLAKGAHVLVQVKGNQSKLLAACEDLARHCAPFHFDVQHHKGHGGIETRTVHIFDLPPDWLPEGRQPLVQQVARALRTVERCKVARTDPGLRMRKLEELNSLASASEIGLPPVFHCRPLRSRKRDRSGYANTMTIGIGGIATFPYKETASP
ncbi:hypothetical protein [Paraburkholderia piptadeniae]|uniref:hypothetical protein n=1 Tax=Paraburkholderia piptadeniae TaxID=1701573 RepID=UPI00117F88E0|nr:hypothetical protein [Paraburkholderia piptadeniae]